MTERMILLWKIKNQAVLFSEDENMIGIEVADADAGDDRQRSSGLVQVRNVVEQSFSIKR